MALRSLSIEVPVSAAHETAALIAAQFLQLKELSLTLLSIDPYLPESHSIAQVHQVDDISVPPFLVQLQGRLVELSIDTSQKFVRTFDDFALPIELMTLRLTARWLSISKFLAFPLPQQHDIVRALARRRPTLHEVALGDSDGTWTRKGHSDVWKEWCVDTSRYPVQFS